MAVGDDATAKADLQQVYRLLAENGPVADPGLLRRIQERSEAARRAVFERNGLLDVAVPAIRALRDGEYVWRMSSTPLTKEDHESWRMRRIPYLE